MVFRFDELISITSKLLRSKNMKNLTHIPLNPSDPKNLWNQIAKKYFGYYGYKDALRIKCAWLRNLKNFRTDVLMKMEEHNLENDEDDDDDADLADHSQHKSKRDDKDKLNKKFQTIVEWRSVEGFVGKSNRKKFSTEFSDFMTSRLRHDHGIKCWLNSMNNWFTSAFCRDPQSSKVGEKIWRGKYGCTEVGCSNEYQMSMRKIKNSRVLIETIMMEKNIHDFCVIKKSRHGCMVKSSPENKISSTSSVSANETKQNKQLFPSDEDDDPLKCIECHGLLETPVLLPCGKSVCKKHVGLRWTEFYCASCTITHAVPQSSPTGAGFAPNHLIDDLLAGKTSAKALHACQLLDSTIIDLDLLKNDPEMFIDETIGRLKERVELGQEALKAEVDRQAREIIDELVGFKQACKENIFGNVPFNELRNIGNLGERKRRVEEWMDEVKKKAADSSILTNYEARLNTILANDEARLNTILRNCEMERNELRGKIESIKKLLLMEKFELYQTRQKDYCDLVIYLQQRFRNFFKFYTKQGLMFVLNDFKIILNYLNHKVRPS